MPGTTTELALQTAVDSDDNADYLTISLANSLRTIDALMNNVTGHTHGGIHQGGPIGGLTTGQIADGAVTSAKIADATIVTADLADGAVTSAKILDGTIATGDLADGSVTTAKIGDAQVTSAKIVDGSITSAKLLDGGIATVDIGLQQITAPLMAANAVATATIQDGAVTSAKIADGTILGIDLSTNILLTNPRQQAASGFGTTTGDLTNYVFDYGTSLCTLPTPSAAWSGVFRAAKAWGGPLSINCAGTVIIGPGATVATASITINNGDSVTFWCDSALWWVL